MKYKITFVFGGLIIVSLATLIFNLIFQIRAISNVLHDNDNTLLWLKSPEKTLNIKSIYQEITNNWEKKINELKLQMQNVDWDAVKWNELEKKLEIKKTNEYPIPVVVTDIDETILDSIDFQVRLKKQKSKLQRELHFPEEFDAFWNSWVVEKKGIIFPKVIEFIKTIYRSNILVIFVSDRKQNTWQYAKDNLINQNYPKELVDHEWMWWLKNKVVEDQVISGKEDRMNYLEDNKISIFLDAFTKVKVNFQIIMRVGDQMTDFNSNFFVDQKHNSKSYVEDKDIDVLWNNWGPKVKFYAKDNQVMKVVSICESPSDDLLMSDQNKNDCKKEKYLFIPGNIHYGHWLKEMNKLSENS